MINIKHLLNKQPDRLGLDIDTKSINLVQLKKIPQGGYEVVSNGSFDIALRGAQPSEYQSLRDYLKDLGVGGSHASVSIEDNSLRIRKMSFPKMPDRDLMEAIKWNFREYIDCSCDEYEVAYTPINKWNEGDQQIYCAYGVSKQAIQEHLEITKQLGLKVVAIEPRATALLAAFNDCIPWDARSTVVCVFMGDTSSFFTVMSDRQMLFSRPMTMISSELLVKHIARSFEIDEKVAKELFDGFLCNNDQDDKDSAGRKIEDYVEALKSLYSQLVIETQRSIDAFCLMFKVEKVDKIYLCGKGAYAPNIAQHIHNVLGIETQIFNPFDKVVTPQIANRSTLYAVAYGLAIP